MKFTASTFPALSSATALITATILFVHGGVRNAFGGLRALTALLLAVFNVLGLSLLFVRVAALIPLWHFEMIWMNGWATKTCATAIHRNAGRSFVVLFNRSVLRCSF